MAGHGPTASYSLPTLRIRSSSPEKVACLSTSLPLPTSKPDDQVVIRRRLLRDKETGTPEELLGVTRPPRSRARPTWKNPTWYPRRCFCAWKS